MLIINLHTCMHLCIKRFRGLVFELMIIEVALYTDASHMGIDVFMPQHACHILHGQCKVSS